MKLRPKVFFVLSAVFIIAFFILVYLKIETMRYAFLGLSIGALIRGFYEESKERKNFKNNN